MSSEKKSKAKQRKKVKRLQCVIVLRTHKLLVLMQVKATLRAHVTKCERKLCACTYLNILQWNVYNNLLYC